MGNFSIAIDGPASSGKSTIAKRIASKLGILYVDTGAMYRAVALYCIRLGISTKSEKDVVSVLDDINMTIKQEDSQQRVFLGDEDVTEKIRAPKIGDGASDVGVFLPVREKLVSIQRQISKNESVIMEGRDVTTNVLPDADVKIYLTANVDVRARRRLSDYIAMGKASDFESVREEIINRDKNDMGRAHNPLRKADDAVEIDGSDLNIDEVTEKIIQLTSEKTGLKLA